MKLLSILLIGLGMFGMVKSPPPHEEWFEPMFSTVVGFTILAAEIAVPDTVAVVDTVYVGNGQD